MGCPTECVIGKNLTFSICAHDPDTGVLTDAASLPIWRLYEDETTVPILTGTMAKLDDANTTSLYAETVACTLGNGFEAGKTYTIYIVATVDGDPGGITFAFKAVTDPAALAVTVSPINMTVNGRFGSALITLIQYESPSLTAVFLDQDGAAVDLSGVALALVVHDTVDDADEQWRWTSGAGELSVSGDDNNQLTLSANATNTGTAGRWGYTLWDTDNGYPKAYGVLAIERSAGPSAP